ncbi:MAG TPA: nucleotide sugar dehydrogenase [Steroidobacteraceae bacterium]|jgi:GDP-mannose 6-dehydrogenase|nr:nucleotide sugar dehydrogenase [Steroidobacteraceae bacterium]
MSTISIFGLGYVGCVSAACFASAGHRVLGVDVAQSKVDQINAGRSTIVEEGIAELVASAVSSGKLSATTSVSAAVQASEISLVCVGTPSRPNGSIDLAYVLRVAEQIGTALRTKGRFHTVVIRSTVMPGTIDTHVIPAIEAASGLKHGGGFAVCSNPEFLREGTSIRDFHEPPFTLVGALDVRHAEPVLAVYAGVTAPTHVVPLRVAETVKYACNCFHGLKVGFANEIGNLCKVMGVDSHEVMRLFCEDKKLNISTAYLRPGFAFGGSCLPKDLRALVHRGRVEDVPMPILEAVLDSNRRQIERAFHMVLAAGSKRIGVLGLAFKAGTDDLRESPTVTLVEMLLGKGCQVVIHDRDVTRANIIGANREFVEREIPHLWSLLRPNVAEVIEASETVVIGNGSPEYRQLGAALDGRMVVDLARALSGKVSGERYQGICW